MLPERVAPALAQFWGTASPPLALALQPFWGASAMAYDLPFLNDHAQHRLNRQLSSLSRDAGHVTDLLSHLTSNARRDAGHYAHDFVDDAWRQGSAVAREVGKQAAKAGRAVQKDPVPAVVAVAGFACLLSLIFASGRTRQRR